MRERTVLRLGRLRLSLVWPEKSPPEKSPMAMGKLTREENEAAYQAASAIILAGGSPAAAVEAGDRAVLALRKRTGDAIRQHILPFANTTARLADEEQGGA